MFKFKIGDKVEIIGNISHRGGSRYHCFAIGDKGTIINVDCGVYSYEVKVGIETQGIYEKDMKLVSPRSKKTDFWVELRTDLKTRELSCVED